MKKIISLLLISTLNSCYTSQNISKKKIQSKLVDFFNNANHLNIEACQPMLYLQCATEKEAKDNNVFREILKRLTQERNFKSLKITAIEWKSDTAFLTTKVYFNNYKPIVIYKAEERIEVGDNEILIMDKRILYVKNSQTHFFIFPECSLSQKMRIIKK